MPTLIVKLKAQMMRKNRCQNSQANYLDAVPVRASHILWHEDDENDELVVLDIENKGVFNKIAQMFFKKPKVSHVHLDKFGSFVWLQIDGKRTVYDIAERVKERFGEDAEPLYPRIIKFMQIMKSYDFVRLEGL